MGMSSNIRAFFIENAVKILIETIDKETIAEAVAKAVTEGKDFLDSILDAAKMKIRESENTIDDRVLLPIIEIIEKTLGLPED